MQKRSTARNRAAHVAEYLLYCCNGAPDDERLGISRPRFAAQQITDDAARPGLNLRAARHAVSRSGTPPYIPLTVVTST
ncbi:MULTISPECIES: hypothetical protein [Pseudomonas]|uniref:hypothetical protein n=1 Tax=Pseudomonas TaxID=286 RepID=UPI0023D89857|nr:hypothetical protein [Pseudomonas sp. PSE14]WEJ72523.1 hypothetical protein O6P39_01140 [Pseudomonas sp. PSE14]